jgi:CBS domain-containing protein
MPMGRKIVPDLVQNQVLTILSPSLTIREAAKAMSDRNIGAVLVAEGGRLRGICTERDVAHRVVAKGRDPNLTTIADVMTADPAVVSPDDTPAMALDTMRRIGCRHLPVMDGERIVGMLSIRDLYAAIHEEMEEDLRQRDDFIMGSGYSVAH